MPDQHAQRPEVPFDEHATGQARLLDPRRVRLFRTPEGVPRAVIEDDVCCLRLMVMCSFPLSRPRDFVSLRDGSNREIGLIEHLGDLDRESRHIADDEIERRYFLPEITAVRKLEGHFGTYDWHVETNRGPRSFVVRGRGEHIVQLPPHRVAITDVLGNRYQIPDTTHLDRKSQALLYRVL